MKWWEALWHVLYSTRFLCLIHLSILPQVVLPAVSHQHLSTCHREPSSPELWSVTMVFVSFLSNAIITLNSYSVKRTSADPNKCLCSPVRVLASACILCEPVRHLLAALRWETLHHTAEVRGENRRSECWWIIRDIAPLTMTHLLVS